MGEWIKVTASDGHELDAYVATPAGEPIGGLVVMQEIFGVNKQIQGVVDAYAQDGFLAIAPSTFDRYEKGVQIGYEGEDLKKAFELYQKLDVKTALLDVAAAFKKAKELTGKGVGVTGFCYGGLMSWLSATRGETDGMKPACTVGYYAGGVGGVATEQPVCPVMLHFGGADSHIGVDQIDAVRTAHPDVSVYVYEGAQHGFANVGRKEYAREAAKLARERTVEFLKKHIA